MTTNEMYQQLGISPEVLDFGQRVLDGLDEEMSRVDDIAEYNQAKVLSAMHKNRLNATHFNLSSGYGYDDEGRDNLERVYADVFHTEAALVRPQITCGTHALALALCPKDVKHVWNLSVEEAAAYLKGQTFSAEGEKGWYLICVDDISLGWGKLAGGVMKNHYPKGLRK